MKRVKHLLVKSSEFLLIALVIFYWASTETPMNPVAIGLVLILVLQFFIRNGFLGVMIPSLLILVSLFMILALFSEFSEFPVINADAKKLLLVGIPFIIALIIASGLMINKYTRVE